MPQRTQGRSNSGPATCLHESRCTPKAGAPGWWRSSSTPASGSPSPAPGRGTEGWNARSSAAGWRRATARSAARNAAAAEQGGRGGVPGKPRPSPGSSVAPRLAGGPNEASAPAAFYPICPGLRTRERRTCPDGARACWAAGRPGTTGPTGEDRPARCAAVRGPLPACGGPARPGRFRADVRSISRAKPGPCQLGAIRHRQGILLTHSDNELLLRAS